MKKLTIDQIIQNIEEGKAFEAVSSDYSFTIKIDAYVPWLCGAVHDGHQFRKSLWEYCLHSEYERWFEEDPCTKEMMDSQPIVVAGMDSRFEYDLNRPPETAIYEDAWGKKLWKVPLPSEERSISMAKHEAFYKVIHALVTKLESLFEEVIVYDMHSYNWRRWDRRVPEFNIGTANVDQEKYQEQISSWRTSLASFTFPNTRENLSTINDVFQGNGYFLKYITKYFKNTLVLATEISKIYCDELSGTIYPEVVRSVKEQMAIAIPAHATAFTKKHTK